MLSSEAYGDVIGPGLKAKSQLRRNPGAVVAYHFESPDLPVDELSEEGNGRLSSPEITAAAAAIEQADFVLVGAGGRI